jgi:hypothetical protein
MSEQTLQDVAGWMDDLRSEDASTRKSAAAAILRLATQAQPAPVARSAADPGGEAVLIARLEGRVAALEKRVAALPETALLSQSFLSRAFTVWGHLFVAQLILAIPFVIFFFAALMDEVARW